MTNRITAAEYRQMQEKPKRTKYGNKISYICQECSSPATKEQKFCRWCKSDKKPDKFDSKEELSRWHVLKQQEKLGLIRNLQRQVDFKIEVNGVPICTYKADFNYDEKKGDVWESIVEDKKGGDATITKEFLLKKKLMLACYGIDILIT